MAVLAPKDLITAKKLPFDANTAISANFVLTVKKFIGSVYLLFVLVTININNTKERRILLR